MYVSNNKMGGNNYGLNDSLEYYEYEFDSSDTTNTMDSNYSTLDWPLFTAGRPLNRIAAIKILEVQIPFSWYLASNSKISGIKFMLEIA